MTVKEMAMAVSTRSELFNGRTKINTRELKGHDLYINAVDFLDDGNKIYTVLTCHEFPNNFFFGGTVLTRLMNDMLNRFFSGDISAFNQALAEDSLGVRLGEATASKPGANGIHNHYTTVELIND